MAVVLVGTATAQSSAGVGTLNITLPSNVIDDDLILIAAELTSDAGWNTPSGYSIVSGGPWVKGTSLGLVIYSKVAVSADAGSVVTVDPLTSSQRVTVEARVYRGVDTATPLDGVTPTEANGSNLNVAAPTITPATSGSTVVSWHAIRVPGGTTSNTWTAPSGFGNQVLACSTFASNGNGSMASYDKANVTGATGTITAVSTFGTGTAWIATALVLRPDTSTTLEVHPVDEMGATDTLDVTLWRDSPSTTVEFGDTFTLGSDEIQAQVLIRDVTDPVGLTDTVEATVFPSVFGPAPPPDVHPVTSRLYLSLPEFYRALDADLGWPLLRWLSLLCDQLGVVVDLADRIDIALPGEPGYDPATVSPLADPAAAEVAWLPWLGQFLGRQVRGLGEQAARDLLTTAGFEVGTANSLAEAARSALTGGRYVRVYPQSKVLPGDGGIWDVLIVTRPSETSSSAAVLAAATVAKPAGVVLYSELYVASYDHMRTTHGPHYTDFETAFPTYADATNHIPE